MLADNQGQLKAVHREMNYIVDAIYAISNMPLEIMDWSSDSLASRQTLLIENKKLKQNVLFLAQKQLKFESLETENLRLKSLLRAAMEIHGRVKMAEIIGINPDPFIHEIFLNRGAADGIRVGQPLLGSDGLIGQITAVTSAHSSRALLISDANHALPVQINRNGVRAIAVGSGHLDKLYLAYLPDSADVKVGDLLVSSGLGGRFPFGYPVATITLVKHDSGAPFATAEAKPKALLDRLRHVLVVVHQELIPLPPPGPWPKPPVVPAVACVASMTPSVVAPATPMNSVNTVPAATSMPLMKPTIPPLPTTLPLKPKPEIKKPAPEIKAPEKVIKIPVEIKKSSEPEKKKPVIKSPPINVEGS